jgi:hypothetical protein
MNGTGRNIAKHAAGRELPRQGNVKGYAKHDGAVIARKSSFIGLLSLGLEVR